MNHVKKKRARHSILYVHGTYAVHAYTRIHHNALCILLCRSTVLFLFCCINCTVRTVLLALWWDRVSLCVKKNFYGLMFHLKFSLGIRRMIGTHPENYWFKNLELGNRIIERKKRIMCGPLTMSFLIYYSILHYSKI